MTLEEAEKCEEVMSFVKSNVIRNLCMQMLIGIFLLIKLCNIDLILVVTIDLFGWFSLGKPGLHNLA